MSVFHYDETPLPVGLPVSMNGSGGSYELGLYDGALYSEQYADEPESGVLFSSPDGARRWLEAATAALKPYIKSGDRDARIPDPTGWGI
jgi:hypothetical protein